MPGILCVKNTNDGDQQESGCKRVFLLVFVGLSGACLIVGLYLWDRYLRDMVPPPLPSFPAAPPYTPWPTPSVATTFDYPLLPAEAYGPFENTRYGAHNPAFGARSNCFRAVGGTTVLFGQLYHAGVDLFALDETGEIAWGQATHAPVYAVGDGVVHYILNAGSEGHILIIQHLLADGTSVYSVYWHVSHVQVRGGQPVTRGQAIAVVHNLNWNSHLHWEMRTFLDGSNLFPMGTAGARGTCNGHIAGVGYTWDDDPASAHPDYYGYLDPTGFVESHRP
jgi:murein DD-endopeptidase MepM/ murein hydrolase activator NlpD